MIRYISLVSSAVIFASMPAISQEVAATAETYTLADFAQYAPRTALDMVRQIPGFTIQSDDDGSRGFGQASGNVLINGQRISGKSNDARSALSRIPVGNVERIEIVEGSSLGIAGLSGRVANIIAKAEDGGISGSYSWEAKIREDLPPYFDSIELSATGTHGALTWTMGLESDPRRGAARGLEKVFDGAGNITEARQEAFTFIADRVTLSSSLAWNPDNGHIANLNFEAGLWQPNIQEQSIRTPLSGPKINRLFKRSEDEWNAELSGDYEFGVGPGRLKLIGLRRDEHSPFRNTVTLRTLDASSGSASAFNQTIDEGESILRAEYSWLPREGLDWQVSAEGAFNFLESEAEFFSAAGFGPLVEEPLDSPRSRVEEKRGEISITHGRRLSPELTGKVSLSVEQSELSQTGAAGLTRSFVRPKGYVSTAYEIREGYKINTRLERKVGQLNFFDFISSVNLGEENGRDGNPQLVPQQSWYGEIEIERDFGAFGAGTVKIYAEEIEDLVDRIPLPGGGDGVGNIDSASALGVEFSSTLKFDPLGLEGAQLDLEGNFRESNVTDPLTGIDRRINDDHIRNWEARFRHDLPNTDWAYGFGVQEHLDGAIVTLDRRGVFSQTPLYSWIFLEHKDIYGMTGQIRLENLFNSQDKFRRSVFTPDRRGTITLREDRVREFGPVLKIELSGSF